MRNTRSVVDPGSIVNMDDYAFVIVNDIAKLNWLFFSEQIGSYVARDSNIERSCPRLGHG